MAFSIFKKNIVYLQKVLLLLLFFLLLLYILHKLAHTHPRQTPRRANAYFTFPRGMEYQKIVQTCQLINRRTWRLGALGIFARRPTKSHSSLSLSPPIFQNATIVWCALYTKLIAANSRLCIVHRAREYDGKLRAHICAKIRIHCSKL